MGAGQSPSFLVQDSNQRNETRNHHYRMVKKSDSSDSPPRHRWFQISLRAFLILLTGFGVWLGVYSNRARQQKAAIDRVRALGGRVVFDFQGGITSPYLPDAAPPGPKWLRRRIGPEYVDAVTQVAWIRSPVADDDFAVFENLPNVHDITISDCDNLRGNGFRHLRNLKNLKRLYVHATPIGDEGIEQIKDMQQLDSLFLFGAFTDEGVQHLSQMTWLAELQVGSEHLGRRWVQDLPKALPNCTIAVGGTMY
jgi:hypothetical protein